MGKWERGSGEAESSERVSSMWADYRRVEQKTRSGAVQLYPPKLGLHFDWLALDTSLCLAGCDSASFPFLQLRVGGAPRCRFSTENPSSDRTPRRTCDRTKRSSSVRSRTKSSEPTSECDHLPRGGWWGGGGVRITYSLSQLPGRRKKKKNSDRTEPKKTSL